MLLVSMTVGTIVLMSLGNTPPGSGDFSLARYYQLTPLSVAMASHNEQHPDRWEKIEIVYGQPRLLGLENEATLNAHFLVCSAQDSERADGDILKTERWQIQQSAQPQRNWGATTKTIVIVMIMDDSATSPTNSQMTRVDLLVTTLRREFNIDPRDIHWPWSQETK